MIVYRLIPIVFFLLFLSFSCSSKKDILYLQGINNLEKFNSNLDELIISSGDLLKINVTLNNSETNNLINKDYVSSNNNENRESLIFKGYRVNNDGFIFYPGIEKIYVEGLTIEQAKNKIYKEISNKQIFTNPNVDIKFLNLNFTIIGEVNKPGKYFFDDKINLFQAIGMAGDLTINGKRNNVKIMRRNENKIEVGTIDLTNKNFLNSEFFQVFSNDIIIIDPNTTRIKNAGIIGNSGTLLSLLSFLLSSIIVITR